MDFKLRSLSSLFLLTFLLIHHGSSQRCDREPTGPSGTIRSKCSQVYYHDNQQCFWRIRVDQGRKISLNFDWMNLPACHEGGIYIYENSAVVNMTCDNNLPYQFLSSGSEIGIIFRCSTHDIGKGFNAKYNSAVSATPCGNPQTPFNGTVQVNGYTVGSSATYICNTGYKMTGNAQRTCMVNGSWSGQLPSCSIVSCRGFNPPSNGQLMTNSYIVNYGSVVKFSCIFGYNLVGDGHRTCQKDGTLSGEEPYCQIVSCDTLTAPENGQLNSINHSVNYQSVVNYSCNSGYNLVGDGQRTCQENGTWSGHKPSCHINSAESLTTVSSASGTIKSSKALTQKVLLGVLLPIGVLIILGLLGYLVRSRFKKSEDSIEMATEANAAGSNHLDESDEMEMEDNLTYGSCEASGDSPRQQRATVYIPSKVGPVTGDIYSAVEKGDAGKFYPKN